MHKDVLWFDTAACWKGGFIGQANKVTIVPDASVNAQLASDPTKTYTTPTAVTGASSAYNGKGPDGAAFGTTWGGWYIGAAYEDKTAANNDYDNKKAWNNLGAQKDTSGPYQRNWELQNRSSSTGATVSVYAQNTSFRANAWDVDLKVNGKINWANKDITTDLMQAF